MRRLAALLILLLLSPLAYGAARTASVDGLWSATATWGGAAVPVATDTCTINANVEVVCDVSGTPGCVCGDLTVTAGGTVSTDGQGRTITLGDSTTTYSISNAGTIMLSGGDTLSQDCNAVATANCEFTNSGRVVARGTLVGQGTVAAASGENCPAYSSFIPGSVVLSNCNTNNITVTARGLGLIVDDDARFVGRYLVFTYPAAHRGVWYKIADAVSPDQLVLDFNSNGQNRPLGKGPEATPTGNATVAAASTSVSWAAGITSGNNAYATQGAAFFCDADCPALSNTDPATANEYLPCPSARRITAVTAGTPATLTLESGYPTANCAGGAAATIVGTSSSSRRFYDYVERIAPGDPFVIYNPVTFSIPAASKSYNTTQSYAAGGYIATDNSVTDFEGVRMEFWGRGDSGVGSDIDPLQIGFTASNSTGTVRLRFVDIGFYGGGEAFSLASVPPGATLDYMTAHNPLPTDQTPDPNRGHGLWLNDYNKAGGLGNATVNFFRGSALGDDCMVINGDSSGSSFDWDYIRINYPTCIGASTIGLNSSAQCLDYSDTNLQFATGLTVTGMVCSNYMNGGITYGTKSGGATTAGTVLVRDSLIQNLQANCWGNGSGANAGNNHTLESHTFLNSVCRGVSVNASDGNLSWNGLAGVNAYSSLIADANRGALDPDVLKGVFIETGYVNGSTGVYINGTTPANWTNSDLAITDVAVYRQSCPTGVTCTTIRGFDFTTNDNATQTGTISHFTFGGMPATVGTNAIGGTAIQTSDNTAPASAITVTDSVLWYVQNGFAVQGGGNLTESNNLVLGYSTFCSGGTCPAQAASTLTTGTVGFRSTSDGSPNLLPSAGATPFTMTTSDSTPAGARVAGPANWAKLELLYPPLKALGRPGIYNPTYAKDSDGDGIFDIHDPCDTDANPLAGSCE